MGDRRERACTKCGSLLHHEDDCPDESKSWMAVDQPVAAPRQESDRPHYVPAPHFFQLNHACTLINRAFGGLGCYLVGSSLRTRDYRDVDVRLILADDEYDRLFRDRDGNGWLNALWSLQCVSISLWLSQQTGLPVDFQIQRMTQANERHPSGKRNALGIFLDYPGERPTETEGEMTRPSLLDDIRARSVEDLYSQARAELHEARAAIERLELRLADRVEELKAREDAPAVQAAREGQRLNAIWVKRVEESAAQTEKLAAAVRDRLASDDVCVICDYDDIAKRGHNDGCAFAALSQNKEDDGKSRRPSLLEDVRARGEDAVVDSMIAEVGDMESEQGDADKREDDDGK